METPWHELNQAGIVTREMVRASFHPACTADLYSRAHLRYARKQQAKADVRRDVKSFRSKLALLSDVSSQERGRV